MILREQERKKLPKYSISLELNLTEILLLALSTSVDFGTDAKLNYATTKAGGKFVTVIKVPAKLSIVPLLDLLAKFSQVLVCSQNVFKCSHALIKWNCLFFCFVCDKI